MNLRHKLKEEAQTTSVSIDTIVELEYSNMITTAKISDSIVKFPTIRTLKNTVTKQRRQITPSLPKSIKDLPSPILILYTLTKNNTNFLLFDGCLGGKRGLIFASEDDIKYLAYQKFWYADGTFYTSPSIFYQIYSIHAFDEGLSTPCVYALLADKSEATGGGKIIGPPLVNAKKLTFYFKKRSVRLVNIFDRNIDICDILVCLYSLFSSFKCM